jgi:hypothetical protein
MPKCSYIPSNFGCKCSVCGVISGGFFVVIVELGCICYVYMLLCFVYMHPPAVNTVHIKVCRYNRRCGVYMQTCKGMQIEV